MNYNDFIKEFNEILNDNGIRITIPKTKQFFDLFREFILDNVSEDEKISIREFLIIENITIPPKILPNGEITKKCNAIRFRVSDKLKKEYKELNNK